jgi:hypothetical protein
MLFGKVGIEMPEPAVKWDPSADVARRRLRPADADDVRLADVRAKVRTAGERWTGGPPGRLADVLVEAAAAYPGLAELVRVGGPLLEEFLDGYRSQAVPEPAVAASRDLAGDLIDGHDVAPEVFAGLAARYLIAVVRFPAEGRGRSGLHEEAGPGVLKTHRGHGLVLLVPDLDPERTGRITKQLTRGLAGTGWLTLVERSKEEIADGYAEAADVMRLVVAGRRPSGVYGFSDVLVEYAVIKHERVAGGLVSVIEPLRAHAALWETLIVLIHADYNRNKAARNLFIHRSTLDYRLQRIAGITGCDPTSGRGAQLLTAAVIADTVATVD